MLNYEKSNLMSIINANGRSIFYGKEKNSVVPEVNERFKLSLSIDKMLDGKRSLFVFVTYTDVGNTTNNVIDGVNLAHCFHWFKWKYFCNETVLVSNSGAYSNEGLKKNTYPMK